LLPAQLLLLAVPGFLAKLQIFRWSDDQYALHSLSEIVAEIGAEMAEVAGYQVGGFGFHRGQQDRRVFFRERDSGGKFALAGIENLECGRQLRQPAALP
jgi:hypothetical protein